eukprot:6896884-Prymnesium_polylepis.1
MLASRSTRVCSSQRTARQPLPCRSLDAHSCGIMGREQRRRGSWLEGEVTRGTGGAVRQGWLVDVWWWWWCLLVVQS